MLEPFIRSSPSKGPSQSNSPSKPKPPKFSELIQLEKEIVLRKPNNVTQFIRDWANSRLNKLTLSKQYYDYEEQDQQFQFPFQKGIQIQRRNALLVHNSRYSDTLKKINKQQKLEQTKSVILIKLKNMEMLKGLTNEILWELVEEFEQKQYKHGAIIIGKNQEVTNFYIIISGCVIGKSEKKKNKQLNDGQQFGEDSLLFALPSQIEYFSQGISRIAHIEGQRISRRLRELNIEKYRIICKSLDKIQFFRTLHQDQIGKIAQLALNSSVTHTEIQEQIYIDQLSPSFYIVLKGIFHSFSKKLTQQLRREYNRQFKVSDAFGVQYLKKEKQSDVIISQDYGGIIEIKCSQVEKIIGPLHKLEKRKKRRT